jgi:hypothetical protein
MGLYLKLEKSRFLYLCINVERKSYTTYIKRAYDVRIFKLFYFVVNRGFPLYIIIFFIVTPVGNPRIGKHTIPYCGKKWILIIRQRDL